MPERSLLLLLTAAMLALVLGAVSSYSANEPQGEPAKYVGAAVCGECHGKEEMGGQFQKWTASLHARTYLMPGTGYTEMIDPQATGFTEVGYGRAIAKEAERLGNGTNCLECHAAGTTLDESLREPTFHVEDGTQCETCHGPGSVHATMMQNVMAQSPRQIPPAARMPRLTLDDCTQMCHRVKPSHDVLEFPFNPERAWEEIAHPLAKE